MNQILKRLDIIKSSIAIEEEDMIELQVKKIKALAIDEEVQAILSLIENTDYEKVIQLINEYLNKYSGMVVYEDEKVQGLKFELKLLEARLKELSAEKSETLTLINDFNTQYNIEVGELIQDVLYLRKQILYEQWRQIEDENEEKQNQDEEEAEEIKNKYEEAERDYEGFAKDYEEQIKDKPFDLDEESEKELKNLYKKAARMCHPDTVPDEEKERAEAVFKDLNEANTKKDLAKVREIFEGLEKGKGFSSASDTIDDAALLKAKIEDLRKGIEETEREIEEIKQDDDYQTIISLEDWESHFKEVKVQLEKECETLRSEVGEEHSL